MKRSLKFLLVIALLCPPAIARGIHAFTPEQNSTNPSAQQSDIDRLIEHLKNQPDFSASVNYEISLAMTDEDVAYELQMASSPCAADTLLGENYLIDWQLNRNGETHRGFTAYFQGHCYRYRGTRLQEYHFQWDSVPFLTGDGGVQANGQFVDLLPGSIARELQRMQRSAEFTMSCKTNASHAGHKVIEVNAEQNVNGYVGRNFHLIVDAGTWQPVLVENEYNPAQISEQTTRARFTYSPSQALKAVENEEQLIALYPEVFGNFRESNFRIENLRGLPLPGFSLPTTTGERYTREKGHRFKAPTIIAILESDTGASAPTVDALRKAVASMPGNVDLIMVFTGSNVDSIENITGTTARMDEYLLMNGKSLARTCGTNVFPTILVADRDGIVRNVMLGFNKSLAQDVIQSLALLK